MSLRHPREHRVSPGLLLQLALLQAHGEELTRQPGNSTAHTTLFFFFPGLLLCKIGSPVQCMVLHHKLACMTEWERWVGTISRVGPGAKKLLWGRVMGTTSWKAWELQLNHEPPSGFLPLHSGLLLRVKGKPLHPSTCLCSLFLG